MTFHDWPWRHWRQRRGEAQALRLNDQPLTWRDLCAHVDALAAGFAAQLDPTLDELGDIKTSVSEAVTNCIVHAYPDSIGTISMRLRILDGEKLEIVIRDKGRGIADLQQAMLPMYTTGGEERSGMGFTIMESFMDKLKVKSTPGKGTTVTMLRTIRQRRGFR